MPAAMFEPSVDSRFFRERLRKLSINELVTDDELSSIIGKPYKESVSAFYSAKRAIQRDHKVVVARIRGTGWRRLEDTDILKATEKHSARIRGVSKRAVRELVCADPEKLTPAEQIIQTTKITIYGMISAAASDDGLSRVRGFAPSSLPIGDLIAGMKKAS